MNRIEQLFSRKKENILNIYTTAGYPKLHDTVEIVLALEQAGTDIIELGMPYSDPMADGKTIQYSSAKALANGMHLDLLFEQVKEIRLKSEIPIVLMGYLNQMIQYGQSRFLSACSDSGVDALIIPDLPMDIYEEDYQEKMKSHGIGISFLVTPQTSEERLYKADTLSSAFLYVVSQSSITGNNKNIKNDQLHYFERLARLNLSAPRLIGFGIHDRSTYETACNFANGAIIGSEFIRQLRSSDNLTATILSFIATIKNS